MLFGNTEEKLSGFLACTHKKTCFLNRLLLCINCTWITVLLPYERIFYATFPWILGLIPHYLVQLLSVCTYHVTKRSSTCLPGVIMHLTTCHRKYWWAWKDKQVSHLAGISDYAFRCFTEKNNTGWISPIITLEKGTKNMFSPFTLPSLLSSNFLQLIPPTVFCGWSIT